MKRTWVIAAVILALIVVSAVVVGIATPDPSTVASIRTILSWPVLGSAIIFIFLLLFEAQVRNLLSRGESFKAGPLEFQARQPEPERDEVSQELPTVEEDSAPQRLTDVEWDALTEKVAQTQKVALFWYYSFLRQFLVPRTQQILRSIVASGVMPKFQVDLLIGTNTPDVEREAIYNALRTNGLIELRSDEVGEWVAPTEYARRFVAWLDGDTEAAFALD